ncbi:hypothetical protein HBB16_04305 [Pseudonocardia sp. MCCB 268]|nr:hypothetical protein [Pseudonocardia cytotoxica]
MAVLGARRAGPASSRHQHRRARSKCRPECTAWHGVERRALPGIAAGGSSCSGPLETGLFTTVAAQSRRLRAVSPAAGRLRPRPADPVDRRWSSCSR